MVSFTIAELQPATAIHSRVRAMISSVLRASRRYLSLSQPSRLLDAGLVTKAVDRLKAERDELEHQVAELETTAGRSDPAIVRDMWPAVLIALLRSRNQGQSQRRKTCSVTSSNR